MSRVQNRDLSPPFPLPSHPCHLLSCYCHLYLTPPDPPPPCPTRMQYAQQYPTPNQPSDMSCDLAGIT